MIINCPKRKDQRDVFEDGKVMKVLTYWDAKCQQELGEELVVSYICKTRNHNGAYLALTVRSCSKKEGDNGYNTFLYNTNNEADGEYLYQYRNHNALWLLGGSYTLEEEMRNIKIYREKVLKEVREYDHLLGM